MPSFTTLTYLVLMFIALYFFFFYIVLIIRNKHRIFYYPKYKKLFSLTILIPAHNEEKTIQGTIEAIFNTDYPGLKEVIVINDGSTDNTLKMIKEIMGKYENLKLINKKNTGKADSLNQGIKIATGELIGVVDADSYPYPDAIRKIIGFFNDEKMGAVTSTVFVRNKDTFLSKIQAIEYAILAWTRKILSFVDAVYVTNGPLSIYRKSALIEVGGFDRNTVTEDIDVTWNMLRHGYHTNMCLDSFVTTSVPLKVKDWWRQRERWGIGGIQALIKYRKSFLKHGMLGMFIIPFVSITIVLSMFVFLFSIYIILKKIMLFFFSTQYSLLAKTYIFNTKDMNLHPSILIFFMLVLFITAFVYSRYILIILGKKKGEWEDLRNIFKRMFYLLVYLTIYPLVWFSSIYRLIKKDFRW